MSMYMHSNFFILSFCLLTFPVHALAHTHIQVGLNFFVFFFCLLTPRIGLFDESPARSSSAAVMGRKLNRALNRPHLLIGSRSHAKQPSTIISSPL